MVDKAIEYLEEAHAHIGQLERERDEARAEVERVRETLAETAARNWGRAQKAEAALERVTSDEFKQKITACLPREHRGYGTSQEILALIRNETGGDSE